MTRMLTEFEWLDWGMRAGFRDYIAALEDLVEERSRVTFDEITSSWRFPAGEASLRFTAHAGAMDIIIVNPRVRESEGEWMLVVGGDVPIARLLDAPAAEDERVITFRDVALTVEGSFLFGGVYGPWARMDPVTVSRILIE